MARLVGKRSKRGTATRARRVADKARTIPQRLQHYVDNSKASPKGKTWCCRCWLGFSLTGGLPREIARYAATPDGFGASPAQLAAIRAWPPEQLAVLKQLIPLMLQCPKDPKGKLLLPVKFSFGHGPRPGLRIRISAPDNVLRIRFIAPMVV